jgi:ribose transport system permease protein
MSAEVTNAPKEARGLRIDWRRNSTVLAIGLLVVLVIVNVVLRPNFVMPRVMVSNLTSYLPLMMIAVGQAYIVLGGSIDLSLGATVSLANVIVVVTAETVGGGTGMAIGMAAGLATGFLCGLANGVLIAVFRLQAIVTTFATSIVIGGLALMVLPQAGGALPPAYYTTYAMWIFGAVPFVLLVLVTLVVVVAWIGWTQFHLHLMAVGGNRNGAYQTGLPVGRIRVKSHVIGGVMAAVAALCVLGQTGAGDPLMGQALTLGSVSAVVLGGIALSGGWGSAFGAILGAAILKLIDNVIFSANLPYQYQSIVQGLIILVALAAGIFVSRKPG